MTSVAQQVHELVRAVDLLDHDGASITLTLTRDGWDLSGDAGPDVDDDVTWPGDDPSGAMSAALADLPVRGPAALDVAYVPHSRVVQGRCWEVAVKAEGLHRAWLTGTLRDALERCWSYLRVDPA